MPVCLKLRSRPLSLERRRQTKLITFVVTRTWSQNGHNSPVSGGVTSPNALNHNLRRDERSRGVREIAPTVGGHVTGPNVICRDGRSFRDTFVVAQIPSTLFVCHQKKSLKFSCFGAAAEESSSHAPPEAPSTFRNNVVVHISGNALLRRCGLRPGKAWSKLLSLPGKMTDVLSVPDCHFQLAFAVSSADFTAPFMELRSTPETSSFPACVSRRAATSSRGDERRRKKLAYFSSLMNGAGVRPLLRIHEVLPVEKNIHGHSNGRKSHRQVPVDFRLFFPRGWWWTTTITQQDKLSNSPGS